jgi:enhancing lycopene biosynthesis protein 2
MARQRQAAVVLCGCGRADGSEVHESVSVLIHLARLGLACRCFAPDAWQADVVDHAGGTRGGGPAAGGVGGPERRHCMSESARISRGQIEPLEGLDPELFDLLVFPGGLGAAKNLCDYASAGTACSVVPSVARAIGAFHRRGRAIALCCIAPVLAARVLGRAMGGPGVEVTLGRHDDRAAAAVAAWGSRHVPVEVTEAHLDPRQRVSTTPAYMDPGATPHQVFVGIGRMLELAAAAG